MMNIFFLYMIFSSLTANFNYIFFFHKFLLLINFCLNLLRQKKKKCIQIIYQKNPELKNSEISQIVGASVMRVSRWKKENTYTNKARKRKTKMSKDIKNFLLKKIIQ